MNRPVSLEYEQGLVQCVDPSSCGLKPYEHNQRAQPFKSFALHTRAFCRLNRAFGTRPCTLFSYVANALWTKGIAHNSTMEGEKNRDIFHVCRGTEYTFEDTGRYLYGKLYVWISETIVLSFFLHKWTFYGFLYLYFWWSSFLFYGDTYIFRLHFSITIIRNLLQFLFVQCIRFNLIFESRIIFSLQTRIRKIL